MTLAIRDLEQAWGNWRGVLFKVRGEDTEEPRLEWAAERTSSPSMPSSARPPRRRHKPCATGPQANIGRWSRARSAWPLPLTAQTQTPVPAVVVFATRRPEGFDAARRPLLGNIAQLLTQAFGRIARFAEQDRLAAIGEFASGIAQELRSALTTVSMALESLAKFVAGYVDGDRRYLVGITSTPTATYILADNACGAAPEGTPVTWRIEEQAPEHRASCCACTTAANRSRRTCSRG